MANKFEFNGKKLTEGSKERFSELSSKNWDWQSFYNGWTEGRSRLWQDVKENFDLISKDYSEEAIRLFPLKTAIEIDNVTARNEVNTHIIRARISFDAANEAFHQEPLKNNQ